MSAGRLRCCRMYSVGECTLEVYVANLYSQTCGQTCELRILDGSNSWANAQPRSRVTITISICDKLWWSWMVRLNRDKNDSIQNDGVSDFQWRFELILCILRRWSFESVRISKATFRPHSAWMMASVWNGVEMLRAFTAWQLLVRKRKDLDTFGSIAGNLLDRWNQYAFTRSFTSQTAF